jgi:hypothetical protein
MKQPLSVIVRQMRDRLWGLPWNVLCKKVEMFKGGSTRYKSITCWNTADNQQCCGKYELRYYENS